MNFFRRFREAAICVALLVFPFILLKSRLEDPGSASGLDRALISSTSLIQDVATEAARGASGFLEEYFQLVDVGQDNDRLRREVAWLTRENRALRQTQEENRRLRDLLGLRQRLGGETIAAQVIGRETASYFRVMRVSVDAGQRNFIRPGMPVVAADGLVGTVETVNGRYSDIKLTLDQDSRIDVVVPRTGARALLQGTGGEEYRCHVEYLERNDEVEVGDELYTSGQGSIFPAGILVGTITSVERRDHGLYQDAEVAPAVDFGALSELLILTEQPAGRALEREGEGDD